MINVLCEFDFRMGITRLVLKDCGMKLLNMLLKRFLIRVFTVLELFLIIGYDILLMPGVVPLSECNAERSSIWDMSDSMICAEGWGM